MSKKRAFAASIWVPREGWWITGGINLEEPQGISTTDLYSISDSYFSSLSSSSKIVNTFVLGPILPDGGIFHHCLVNGETFSKYLLIGGSTANTKYSAKVCTILTFFFAKKSKLCCAPLCYILVFSKWAHSMFQGYIWFLKHAS